jgi:hypothetical protein
MRLAVTVVNKAGAQVFGITLEEWARNPTKPLMFDGYTLRLIVEPGEGFLSRIFSRITAPLRLIFGRSRAQS